MDYKAIQELIKTLSQSNVTTLEIESDGVRIKMCKDENKRKSNNEVEFIKQDEKIENVSDDASTSIPKENEIVVDDKNIEIVKSPIVGTFYESSAPGKEPFVKVGSKVNVGDTLCIIEAMKLMNEITSEVNGEIVEILVENEDMVEYGQPIFKINTKS
ncbi:biotin carboxyl carrier protein of acetyl-CoA carboxylase [Clostridium tepidiprofundi DSM 19306]|uniref:Biotin carboxyl carrier protein of acetyl-CoA carboxylase n=1 Tax=Clostridium tepidiprofundi DSM 19306 TaxID=1121338 RepID=A0A151B536_9CLOT|nr:acetyl-CoA carboxylase biotin carboxyl carrier protein [Clostridium tepidiprofundi]KYH34872.1 biotin carboxyl carrier protein of acetyl-CoA carboxylase [Clostridium tepidiprofundi DSM 19306]